MVQATGPQVLEIQARSRNDICSMFERRWALQVAATPGSDPYASPHKRAVSATAISSAAVSSPTEADATPKLAVTTPALSSALRRKAQSVMAVRNFWWCCPRCSWLMRCGSPRGFEGQFEKGDHSKRRATPKRMPSKAGRASRTIPTSRYGSRWLLAALCQCPHRPPWEG